MADKGYPHPNAATAPYNPHGEGYAPVQPPPPYYHPEPVVQQTIIKHVYAMAPAVGPDPSSMTCPSCRQTITTRLDYETTTKTHIMAGLLCCFICWPCAWVPYVMDSCKNANHYCPNCGAFIGTYKS